MSRPALVLIATPIGNLGDRLDRGTHHRFAVECNRVASDQRRDRCACEIVTSAYERCFDFAGGAVKAV